MSYTEELIEEIYPENYTAPVNGGSFLLISLMCLAGFLYSEREKIWRYLFYSPGYGMIENRRDRKTKRYQLTAETDIGKIKIPTLYHPDAQQIEICLFENAVVSEKYLDVKNLHSSYLAKKFITEQEFKQFFPFECRVIEKYGNHFLIPMIHTQEREGSKVSGFIKILGSDHLLIFTTRYSFIDYQGIVLDYLLRLEDLRKNINLDDVSDDEFASSSSEDEA